MSPGKINGRERPVRVGVCDGRNYEREWGRERAKIVGGVGMPNEI